MKRLVNIMILVMGIALLSSCSTTGSMRGGNGTYGYYDNVYNNGYGNPYYYGANPYLFRRPIIHNDIIVIPEQRENVRSRENVRRRQTVSPNSRRRIESTTPERRINRNTAPTRRGSTVAPSTRQSQTPAPESSRSSNSGSRRGNN